MTTRQVRFRGNHLFVNSSGELQVELLDDAGKVVATSTATAGDSTKQLVSWENDVDLAAWQGKPVRFRFRLASGSLYSFWVAPDAQGASNGYVAAGLLVVGRFDAGDGIDVASARCGDPCQASFRRTLPTLTNAAHRGSVSQNKAGGILGADDRYTPSSR